MEDIDFYPALLIFLVNMLGLKDRKRVSIVDTFEKILKESDKRKPNKIWVDKGSEFCNNSFKKWLKDNDIESIRQENQLLLKDLLEH